jgi:hypothetical protein
VKAMRHSQDRCLDHFEGSHVMLTALESLAATCKTGRYSTLQIRARQLRSIQQKFHTGFAQPSKGRDSFYLLSKPF